MKISKLFGQSSDTQLGTSFNLKGLYEGHYKITYRGVPCLKCPNDYVIYQMILNEIQPDIIVEIGTNNGGSALYLADLLDSIGKGVIHTIDIDDRSETIAKNHPRITFFHDGWDEYDLSLVSKYEKVLVIEDSSHQYHNTLNAIEKFSRIVSLNSYLIVEDGIIDELGLSPEFEGGPVKAIKEFLPKHPEFIIDERWVNMFGQSSTFNTLGYLKKII